jgi:osmotically-inducible protein OsmY
VSSLVVSCATVPAPSSPETTADQALANRVYVALNDDPTYFFRHVDVRVDNGVANLSGYVWSTDAIYRARKIARTVPGINQVVTNNLELERQGRTNGIAR